MCHPTGDGCRDARCLPNAGHTLPATTVPGSLPKAQIQGPAVPKVAPRVGTPTASPKVIGEKSVLNRSTVDGMRSPPTPHKNVRARRRGRAGRPHGALRVIVGATGVLEVKTVESKRVAGGQHDGPNARADETYGHLVAEHLVAVNHDHYFAFRLDFDVDGTDNSFIESRLVRRRLSDTSTRRSLSVLEEQVATSERAARFPSQPHEPSRWRVVSGSRRNAVGQRTGYEVLGHGATSLLAPDDPAQTRAGFTAHPLWITAYDRDQLYAAGAYPTLGAGGGGLPRWSARDRPLENKDLVV